jgi:hypothetical protein
MNLVLRSAAMIRALIVGSLCISMAFLCPSTASAGLITVQEVTQRGGLLSQKILKEMESPEAQARIAELGISPDEARQRVAALSDHEIQEIVNSQAPVQAGGDIIIGLTTVLLIIIIILLIRR